jgi:DNA-binding response OmpR family regulator
MKVLIVEDEETLSKVLEEKLKKENFTTKIVKDGNNALLTIKDFLPDVILLDIILPGKNGFDILEEIKEDFDLKIIPVIILSNISQDEDIKKGLELGAVDYLAKDQHPLKEILEIIQRAILENKHSKKHVRS